MGVGTRSSASTSTWSLAHVQFTDPSTTRSQWAMCSDVFARLDGLIDDLYYLEGAPSYARLTLPPAPSALLIVNLGAPFRVRGGSDVETAE